MRILVLSDTHGNLSRPAQVLRHVRQKPLDMIIHCGDSYRDAMQLERQTGLPTVWVKGNTDGCFDDNGYALVETECGTLLVTHGHMEHVDFSQQNLYYKALELGCVGAIYGHTHRAACGETGGVTLLNPGSLCQPRDGSGGTYALLFTSSEGVSARICYYKDLPEISGRADSSPDGKPKVEGGFLRKILNYSDRF